MVVSVPPKDSMLKRGLENHVTLKFKQVDVIPRDERSGKFRIKQDLVGARGFECARGAQASLEDCFTRLGGLRLEFQIVEPYASLARFQEFFSFACRFMVRKFFSIQNIEFPENLTPFRLFKLVLIQPSSQVIRDTNVSLAIFPFEYI